MEKNNVVTTEAVDYYEDHEGIKVKGILKTFIVVILILAILFGIFLMGNMIYWYNNVRNEDAFGSETNFWTAIFKGNPDYEIEHKDNLLSFDDIVLTITPKENYKYVTFKFCLYDSNGNILKQFFITENDLESGKVYKFTYELLDYITLTDIKNAAKAKCVVHKYE